MNQALTMMTHNGRQGQVLMHKLKTSYKALQRQSTVKYDIFIFYIMLCKYIGNKKDYNSLKRSIFFSFLQYPPTSKHLASMVIENCV